MNHQLTATRLKTSASNVISIAKKTRNTPAINTAEVTANHLLEIAEYHQEKADEINRQINLTKLHQAAKKTLIRN